jgi:peptidoglycan/xylan/chitin deacetylase (PgdA/CDA1 family)
VFFVAVGKIGQPGMMDWPMLEEMSRSGMSVQSHTMSHPFLKQLSDAQVRTELLDSKRIIEQHLHTAVNFVSLPNGSYGDNYKSIAMACGYLGGCSSKIGYNNTATDGYLLRMILISSRFDINEFREIVLNKGFFEPFLALKQSALDMVRSFIGENLYMDIYRVIFGLR